MRAGLAAALVACCVALAAACGGSSGDASTAGTAPAPAPTAPGGGLAALLPPEDAIPGLRAGSPRPLATPRAFVDALYQIGEPSRGPARRRLQEGGYAEGLLRDQLGRDPEAGPALARSYAIRLRDGAAARREVAAAAAEVLQTPLGEAAEFDIPEIPDARGLRIAVSQGGVDGSALFVTFPHGSDVVGIQVISRAGAELPEEEVIRAAQDIAARSG